MSQDEPQDKVNLKDTPALDRLALEMVRAMDGVFVSIPLKPPAELPFTGLREIKAIATLAQHGPLSMTALARRLEVALPAATHVVDRLASSLLVERTYRDDDRRTVMVALTRQGRDIHEQFLNHRVAVVLQVLQSLAAPEGLG
jgi:DNA-binding MarR family transcriptional regulator